MLVKAIVLARGGSTDHCFALTQELNDLPKSLLVPGLEAVLDLLPSMESLPGGKPDLESRLVDTVLSTFPGISTAAGRIRQSTQAKQTLLRYWDKLLSWILFITGNVGNLHYSGHKLALRKQRHVCLFFLQIILICFQSDEFEYAYQARFSPEAICEALLKLWLIGGSKHLTSSSAHHPLQSYFAFVQLFLAKARSYNDFKAHFLTC